MGTVCGRSGVIRVVIVAVLAVVASISGLAIPGFASSPAAQYATVSIQGPTVLTLPNVQFGTNMLLSDRNSKQAYSAETTIAVNPRDQRNLVAGFMDTYPTNKDDACSFFFTTDGGGTWTRGGVAPVLGSGHVCFDPALGADANGNFYFSYEDQLCDPNCHGPTYQLVAKSTDGGRSFPTFAKAARNGPQEIAIDKDYIAVDTHVNSPFRGTIYVGYTALILIGRNPLIWQMKVVFSRDGGLTWSASVSVGPGYQSPQIALDALPVVAPDGTVYLFYSAAVQQAIGMSIKFSKSSDGGQTWTEPADVASNLPSTENYYIKNADTDFGTSAFHGLLVGTFPTAAIAPDGTIYVAWSDFPSGSCVILFFRPACINSDVRLSTSRDGGKSWSTPVKVSDETNPTDQFFPWIAVNSNGLLSIAWLDKRLDPNNINYDVYYTNTLDGITFLKNVRVTAVSSSTGTFDDIGDYIGLAATQTSAYPVWCDLRNGHQQVFAAPGALTV